MTPDDVRRGFEDPRVSASWPAFVDFVGELEDDLERARRDGDYDLLSAFVREFFSIIRDFEVLFPRLVSCELVAVSKDQSAFGQSFETAGALSFSDDRDRERIVQHLVAAMIVLLSDQQSESRPPTTDQLVSLERDLQSSLGPNFLWVSALLAGCLKQSGPTPPAAAGLAQDGYEPIPGTSIQAGDAIFREQDPSLLKIMPNPMRKFGHAGIYLGCPKGSDPNQAANHEVIHVINANPACQQQTLVDFCKPKGQTLTFWGFYSASLTPTERSSLITKAQSLVGGSVYSFRHYKTPSTAYFRCDGFVEYLYEHIKPSIDPLRYRLGLFEDDDWKTINPSALRNCFADKTDLPSGFKI